MRLKFRIFVWGFCFFLSSSLSCFMCLLKIKTCHRCFYSIVYLRLDELSAMLILRFLYVKLVVCWFVCVCVVISFVPVEIDMAHHALFFCCRCFCNRERTTHHKQNQKPTITSETKNCVYMFLFAQFSYWMALTMANSPSRTCCFIRKIYACSTMRHFAPQTFIQPSWQ